MLEAMRRNSRSWFIYAIFAALILVFVLSFGPQAGQGTGCSPASNYAVKVADREVSDLSWRFAILATTGSNPTGKQARAGKIRERIMDQLIMRELAAGVAQDLGFSISLEEARQSVLEGTFYLLGNKLDGKPYYYETRPGEDAPRFSANALEQFARNLGLPNADRLIDEQRYELLAAKGRNLLLTSIRVSPEEVRQRFDEQNDKVEIEYVRFDSSMFKNDIVVTAADIDAYLTANDKALKEKFEKEKARYTGLSKELRLGLITVKKGAAPGDDALAKAKIDAALRRIKGGEAFDKVAQAVSEDEASAKRGGDLNWRPAVALRLGEETSAAAAKLEKGAVSDVIASETGYSIVKLLDSREGDQTYDQVKRDLAEEALRTEKAKALAKAKADETFTAAKAGGKLAELFPAPAADAPRKNAPRFEKGEGITRSGDFIPGIGPAPELVKSLFDELKPGDLYGKVFETGDDLFVVRLVTRKLPDEKDFEKERERLASFLAQDKGGDFLQGWIKDLCASATAKGEISVNPLYINYGEVDEKGNEIQTAYAPCMTLDPLAALAQ